MKRLEIVSLAILAFALLLLAGCQSGGKGAAEKSEARFSPSIKEALSTGNFELCSKLTDSIKKQDCYFYTILLNSYPDRCGVLENTYYRDICTIIFVDKTSICNNPAYEDKYSYFCMWNDSESLNLDLQNGLFKYELGVRKAEDCAALKAERVRDLCYLKLVDIKYEAEWEAAIDAGNYDYVLPPETISLKDRIVDSHLRNLFIKKVAWSSEHPEYCNQLTEIKMKTECMDTK